LKEHLPPFCFGVAVFIALIMGAQYLFDLTKMIVKGLPVSIALQLFLYYIPSIIVLTFPMSMLFATLWTFGRLSGENELVAMFAGGMSLYRLLMPVIGMGLVVSLAAIAISEFVVPVTTDASDRLKRQAVNFPLKSDRPFFIQELEGGEPREILYVTGGFDLERKVMRGVTMMRYEKKIPVGLLYAERLVYTGPNHWRTEGMVYVQPLNIEGKRGHPEITAEQSIYLRKTPEDIAVERKDPVDMSFRELMGYIHRLAGQGADTDELEVRLWDKLSIPFASLVFVLIGAPLGIRPHRASSARGFGYSVLIIFAYYVVWHYMSILGQGGAVSPMVASWLPDFLGLLAGTGLLMKTAS